MQLTVQIPDDIAQRLIEAGGDLSRRALEGMALEGMALERMALEDFKTGNLNKPDLRRLLGFGTRWQLDGLLKAHGVFEDYTLDDFERECQALKSLGF